MAGQARGGVRPWRSAWPSRWFAGARCWWFAPSRSAESAVVESSFSPLGDSLFFAPAKKSKQKKAGPCVAPPTGVNLRCSAQRGRSRTRRPIGASNMRSLLSPFGPPLLGATKGTGTSTARRSPPAATTTSPATAGACFARARSAKPTSLSAVDVAVDLPSPTSRREAQWSGGMEAPACLRRL